MRFVKWAREPAKGDITPGKDQIELAMNAYICVKNNGNCYYKK